MWAINFLKLNDYGLKVILITHIYFLARAHYLFIITIRPQPLFLQINNPAASGRGITANLLELSWLVVTFYMLFI